MYERIIHTAGQKQTVTVTLNPLPPGCSMIKVDAEAWASGSEKADELRCACKLAGRNAEGADVIELTIEGGEENTERMLVLTPAVKVEPGTDAPEVMPAKLWIRVAKDQKPAPHVVVARVG